MNISNTNTLFAENADYMGLSASHQLRGRVGRSNRVAYTYFMYGQQKILNEVSEKRLGAIKGLTELGFGFKIAMRDLSIRGVRNLLDAQQHDFIDSVESDMYSQMLSKVAARKQGKNIQDQKTSVETGSGVDAYIPGAYITDERQRTEIYKQIRQLKNMGMYEELEVGLLDRLGEYPDKVVHLLTADRIKTDGDRALLESIRRRDQRVKLVLGKVGTKTYPAEQLSEALSATNLKADLIVEKKRMAISSKLSKDYKKVAWVQGTTAFTTALWQEKYKHSQETDSL